MTERRFLSALLAAALAAGALALTQVPTGGSEAAAQTLDEPYSWRNVEIAGGGFVPGIVFNQTEPDLIYARTDIGGAYRWEPDSGRWTPLLDWVGWDEWGYNGVAGLATDPVDPDRVYVAAGMYTNDWDPNNGAILRSADRGETWEVTELPFKLGGNMPGRGMGERIAVDPNDNSVVYLGAPSGHGLWRSTDYGVTWSEVSNFPNPGNYAADPDDPNGYLDDNQGVTWVAFDESSGSAGDPTPDVYIGVADKENTVYRSTDAGAGWERIAGQPTGFLAHKGVVDHVNGLLYIATSDTGGPYDGAEGDVWKYATDTGEWTRISPVPSGSEGADFGYSGLTIDRQNPDTLMVATQLLWWPDIVIFRSTDAGETWTRAWDWTNYPERSFRYEMDISEVPWLDFATEPEPPEVTPKLGWMTEALEIDPFDSDRMMYGTGATIYGTENLSAWDEGGRITIEPMVGGLEETAVLDLASPPSGAPLLSALGDIAGFRHDDLDTVPTRMFSAPNFTSTTSLDFAETNPDVVVRAGNAEGVARAAFSQDGGANWYPASSEPDGVTGGGTIASAADGGSVVWSPAGAGVHRADMGGSAWTASAGIPAGAIVEADRVNPEVFYGASGGRFYISTDGGASFTASPAAGLPTGNVKFTALPDREGEIWLAGDGGLVRSTDGGTTFTAVAGVDGARNIAHGAAAPGVDHPALYLVGTVDGVEGVFRSDDAGAAWVRINDDQHQWGNMGEALSGDPRVYGRVYVGTNGRGIQVGESAGTEPPTTTPPPTGDGCSATYAVAHSWAGGFQAAVTVRNTGSTAFDGWSVSWTFPGAQTVAQAWNGEATQAGREVTVRNAGYNGVVPPGGSVTVGFNGTGSGPDSTPARIDCTGG
ncbi:photosystem II stability/assembly factor-like uncharacterized protein [Actinoalloteichus hoggarensis]|uniref:Xyloglucanase n=1 Tax=Actinoalloteichus hoggarensis TaxID=1470176 RepID=A0A221W5M5_9PSEU|nr:cellulose binding domain-containing protein [Actinoalloteichus hoggarensis]ASO21013.1 Xyloglucanase precursor [Actinoalloteichus hoggarensis]MBB5920944.1 photosystem II stability/assembly factor-like uncharacterized protein [Actinoalloteichus hoggarensis]